MTELRFCWWNVCDYAEFVPDVDARPERGPTSAAEYDEKTRRLTAAFDAMYGTDLPELVGLCELTPAAARRLQTVRFPDHDLFLSDPGAVAEYQIGLLAKRGTGLTAAPALIAADVPRSTRDMPVMDFTNATDTIRFVFCHWTAFGTEASGEYRGRLADALRGGVFDFLNPALGAAKTRHVVVLGDLNEEPFEVLFDRKLSARRYRAHARQRDHWSDADVRRVRLYNCAWRFLGEQLPHAVPPPADSPAGTYYRTVPGKPAESGWHGYDHVLVSGGLLSDRAPFLDERRLRIRADAGSLIDGRPARFAFEGGTGVGLSDHLPITGVVALA